jgi:hypothetical protein
MVGVATVLQNVVRGSKDAALALTIRRILNVRLDAFGEVTEVSLDTSRRRAQARLVLRGEAVPISIDIRKYEIERVDGSDCFTIVAAIASREWLTAALHQFVVGRRFHISRKAAAVARLLM